MGRDEERFSAKCFLNVLLVNSYPLLFFYLRNIFEINFVEFLTFFLCSSILVSIVYVGLSRFTSNIKSSLMTILLIICFYSGGYVWSMLDFHKCISKVAFSQLYILFFMILSFFIWKAGKVVDKFYKVVQFIIIILFCLLFLTNISNLKNYLVSNFKSISLQKKSEPGLTASAKKLPDIYFIILDSYENGEQLKKHFNFNNESFLSNLKRKGFYVAPKSTSNYIFTKYSVPSMLNYAYLQDLGISNSDKKNSGKLISLYKNNALVELLYKNNYYISYINLDNAVTTEFNHIDKNYYSETVWSDNLFKDKMLEHSVFFWTFKSKSLKQSMVLNSFKYLEQALDYQTIRPKFVFAHFCAPHSPYLFLRNGDSQWVINRYDDSVYKDGYRMHSINKNSFIEQTLFINNMTDKIVKKILSKNKNTVIILISDHGVALKYKEKKFHTIFERNKDMETRFGNLMTVYFPDKDYKNLYESITPVNLIRVVSNKYFNQNLPRLPDKNYFTEMTTLFDPQDVTRNYYEK